MPVVRRIVHWYQPMMIKSRALTCLPHLACCFFALLACLALLAGIALLVVLLLAFAPRQSHMLPSACHHCCCCCCCCSCCSCCCCCCCCCCCYRKTTSCCCCCCRRCCCCCHQHSHHLAHDFHHHLAWGHLLTHFRDLSASPEAFVACLTSVLLQHRSGFSEVFCVPAKPGLSVTYYFRFRTTTYSRYKEVL